MERPLRQKPSPYPGAVAWSRDNILAVGQERSVALLNPADLVNGDAGFVRLTDDTAAGNGVHDATFPAGIENQRRHTDALAVRGMLHRPVRPEVAARQVVWSPVLDVQKKNTPPRCVVLVVSTTHAVTVHAPSARDTCSEWHEVCDLSRLERDALEREEEVEDANAGEKIVVAAPAPRVPRETSAHVASLLRAAAAPSALPAPPATPAAAATARRSLPAAPLPREPSPSPPNALAEGTRAEVDRGNGEWLPATVEGVFGLDAGVFRVKVRYDVAPAKGAEAEWLLFEDRPRLIVRHGRDAQLASHFEFPPATAGAVGNVAGKKYRLRRGAGPEPRAGAAGAGDPKPELEDARPIATPAPAPKDRDSDDDDEDETLMDVALAAAAAPDPAKPAAKRAKGAHAPFAKLKDEYADVSETARAAARAAVEKAVEAAEKAGGKLELEDAAATATKAVFEKAPADEKALACVADNATDKESKRARNDALVALSFRARDAFLEARAVLGIDAVYAKGKHFDEKDKKCLEATIGTAAELVAEGMKRARARGSMDRKAFATQAKKAARESPEVDEPTGANAAAAAPPPPAARASRAAAAAAVVIVDSDSDDDDETLADVARDADVARTPRPAALGRTAGGGAGGASGAVDASSPRRAQRLAALSAAWSASPDAAGSRASLVAVGAKSGHVVLWSARATERKKENASSLGIEARRLGSTRVADAWVTALAFLDDGTGRLVVGASDGSVAAWRVAENVAERGSPSGVSTSASPLLARTETFCAADGVAVTSLAADASARLFAAGKASGAVSVFFTAEAGDRAPAPRAFSSRVFFEPVAGATWCASPLASGVSRLVVTSTSGLSASMDATASPAKNDAAAAVELTPPSVAPPAPLRVPGAAAPDGADVPAEFHAGLAASPAGVFVARVRAFHNSATAAAFAKANEKEGKMMIAARARRGAVVLEPALPESPEALERAVARVASGSRNATSLGSLWDVRAAAEALGAEGHAAAARGAESAEKRAGRDEAAKARAARMRTALASAATVSLPADATEGLACRACGAREDSADAASRWCASCGLPLRAALESAMGLKSEVV